MNKLTMKSADLTQINIEKIAKLFPNVITEARDGQGKTKRAIDFDLLKQELSDVLIEGDKERYLLTWPGKKEAILNANSSIDKTLRPINTDSVDWDNTQNVYIEGDNLEALKLLQESYLNKIKCICIDPPYNTGHDFLYNDDFKKSSEEYHEESGQIDVDGNRLFQNTESNGRFHSDWLTMMYSRLKLARNLLREDGVIFICIDDNEVHNLRKICDEIFGAENFVTQVEWQKRYTRSNNTNNFTSVIDHIVIYSKTDFRVNLLKRDDEANARFTNPDNDPRGPWKATPMLNQVSPEKRPNLCYPITNRFTGTVTYPDKKAWRIEETAFKQLETENRLWWGVNKDKKVPDIKTFLSEVRQGMTPINFWEHQYAGHTDIANNEIKNLFGTKIFDTPKPTLLIKRMLEHGTNNEEQDIILDFFSGSATTAESIMQLNAEDDGNRRFILVQLPELTDNNTVAYQEGYKNICEIGKERIRRAAKKIKEQTGTDIDYGFRVYRVDSSNMKDVYYTPDKLGQMNLDDVASNIKEDRTGEDLLIQVMLECGLELSLPMETKDIEGKTVHYVAGNSLIACFDEEVSESVIKKIAEDQPLRVVFRDSSFRDDSARINVEELFKLLSPSTEIQVL